MVARLIPLLDAFARFRPDIPPDEVAGHVSFYDPIAEARALVVEGDAVSRDAGVIKTTHFLRDVEPPMPEDTPVAAIFVTGDLLAPDAIVEEIDSDNSPPFLVLGSVRVRSFFLYGSASEIVGDLVASDTVFGFYNHGSLKVGGDLRARVLLDFDYTWQVGGAVACDYVLGGFDRANFSATHPPEDLGKVLVWDAVTDRDDIAYSFIWGALTRGEPILRPPGEIGTAPVPQLGRLARERLAEIAARRDAGEEVTEIDLKSCELRFVPEELRAFPGLRRVVLDDNRIGGLPAWFGELRSLSELRLKDCGLTVVPGGLDRLPALRVLALDGNPIVDLPDDDGPLAALEVLTMGVEFHFSADDEEKNPDLLTAVIDLGELPRIRIVEQRVSSGIRYGDLRVWNSATLESLNLDMKSPIALPAGLTEATNLRVLSVSLDGENLDRSIAVLAGLPKLELLYLHIFSNLTRDDFERVCAAVPRAFVRHWSASPDNSGAETALIDRARGWDVEGRYGIVDPEERARAADAALAGMDLRHCFQRCEDLDTLLELKAETMLGAALAPAASADRALAAADWGDGVAGAIPDLGDLLWRYPFTGLALARALAVTARLLRPGRAGAAAGLDHLRDTLDRDAAGLTDYRVGRARDWIDRAARHLEAAGAGPG